MQPRKMPHISELDGIRAIAVALVFLSHAGLGNWVPGGLGVTVFFFLSGYLITSLLVADQNTLGSVGILGFYQRRVLRIIPPMWIAVLAAALLVWTGLIKAAIDPLGVLFQVLFLINYADLWTDSQGVPGIPLWSLAVEEHFYILFPLMFIMVLSKMPPHRAAAWCLLTCAAVLMMRLISIIGYHELFHTYYWSHTRADSILFGCCLALWNNPVLDPKMLGSQGQSILCSPAGHFWLASQSGQTYSEKRSATQSKAQHYMFCFPMSSIGADGQVQF